MPLDLRRLRLFPLPPLGCESLLRPVDLKQAPGPFSSLFPSLHQRRRRPAPQLLPAGSASTSRAPLPWRPSGAQHRAVSPSHALFLRQSLRGLAAQQRAFSPSPAVVGRRRRLYHLSRLALLSRIARPRRAQRSKRQVEVICLPSTLPATRLFSFASLGPAPQATFPSPTLWSGPVFSSPSSAFPLLVTRSAC